MIEKVRKPGRAKNIFAYILFGAICLTFVFIGMDPTNIGGLSVGGSAASVNGEAISIADYQNSLEQLSRRFQSQLNALPAAERREENARLRQRALEQLIDLELIAQAAKDVGVRISDKELATTIGSYPVFQESGRFQASRYRSYLQAMRTTTQEFESQLRKQLSGNQLREVFTQALVPMEAEAEMIYKARESKLNLSFVRYSRVGLRDIISVAPAAVDKFAKENMAQIETYYKDNKGEFSTSEQVRASHILVKAKKGDADSEGKALEKIKIIAERAKKEKFEDLAAELSEDVGSKAKKGDLGYFERGANSPEVEEVAFSLPPGQISGPIKSKFGYHLIKVADKRPPKIQPLEQVKTEIARRLLQDKQVGEVLDEIRKVVKSGNQKQLSELMSQYKLQWDETGEFPLDRPFIPKLGQNDVIVDRAVQEGRVGEILPEVFSHAGAEFIVKVKDIKVAQRVPTDELEFDRLSMLGFRRASEVFNNWATEIKKTAQIKRNQKLLAF